MELFDFVKSIGGYISFSGSYDPKNSYINADLQKDSAHCYVNGGGSCYGRSASRHPSYIPTLDLALRDLAKELSGQTIRFSPGFTAPAYIVPELTHTDGYRGGDISELSFPK